MFTSLPNLKNVTSSLFHHGKIMAKSKNDHPSPKLDTGKSTGSMMAKEGERTTLHLKTSPHLKTLYFEIENHN